MYSDINWDNQENWVGTQRDVQSSPRQQALEKICQPLSGLKLRVQKGTSILLLSSLKGIAAILKCKKGTTAVFQNLGGTMAKTKYSMTGEKLHVGQNLMQK